MKSFKQYIYEKAFSSTPSVDGLISKINNISNEISATNDTSTKKKLIADKNKLLSYISVLGIKIRVNKSGLIIRRD